MTIGEIKTKCESLSTEELYFIVNNKIRYTETIVRVAQQELRNRNPTREEINHFKKVQARRAKVIDGDIHEDLLLWEKILFFFIFIPRFHFLVLRDYRKRKYVLKVRQAGYFMVAGAVFFLPILLVGAERFFSLKTAAILWAASFPVAYAFNYYYYKGGTIRRLAARTYHLGSGEKD
jgi:hypothetical protein